MAPEQASNPHKADIRADIYSLGATFYFCLTHHTPFQGTEWQKLVPLRQLRPEIPEGLAILIEEMIARSPEQRPQVPRQVADALTPYTLEPIGPPSDDEMPQLSPAASGANR